MIGTKTCVNFWQSASLHPRSLLFQRTRILPVGFNPRSPPPTTCATSSNCPFMNESRPTHTRTATRQFFNPWMSHATHVLHSHSYTTHTCCSVLQCVAVCCSVLQCVLHSRSYTTHAFTATRQSLHSRTHPKCWVVVRFSELQCASCSASRVARICRSVLQCVAVCCSVLQCVAVCCRSALSSQPLGNLVILSVECDMTHQCVSHVPHTSHISCIYSQPLSNFLT